MTVTDISIETVHLDEIAVGVLAEGDLEGVGVDRCVALIEDRDVEPRIGRHDHLRCVGKILERAPVKYARRSLPSPAGAEVKAAFLGPVT